MFKNLRQPVLDIPILAGLAGSKTGADGRIFAVALRTLKAGGEVESWHSLVRYPAFDGKDRRRSGLAREMVFKAPARQDVVRELRRQLRGAPFVVAFCELDSVPEIADMCEARVVDLVFAAQFLMPWLPSFTPKGLWEHINRPRRWGTVSMTVEAMAALGTDLLKALCGKNLNDLENPPAPALRFQLAASGTLFGALFVHLTEH